MKTKSSTKATKTAVKTPVKASKTKLPTTIKQVAKAKMLKPRAKKGVLPA